MKHFRLIAQSFLMSLTHSFMAMRFIQLLAFAIVLMCFFGGSYFILYRIFAYLQTVELIGPGLMDRLIEMAFYVFFSMLLFSNVITSFSTFYNNKELDFLFAQPIRPTSIYLSKLFENCVYASWATMVLAIPLILAYGVATKAQFLYYPMSIFSIVIYMIIPATLASLLIFTIMRIFPRLSSRDVILLSLLLIGAITFLYIRISNPQVLKVFQTESEQELLQFAANLTTVGGVYVPSTWLSAILKNFSAGTAGGWFYFTLLLAVSVSSIILAFILARLLYARSWLYVGEHATPKKNHTSRLLARPRGPTNALLFKDFLTFIREPTQWVQLSIFLVLLAVYIFALRRTPLYFGFPFWRTIVSFANFAYICFVLATFGVRFIFPTISLEHDAIWFLASSPLAPRKIVLIKYFANLFVAIIILESLLILANVFIQTDGRLYVIMPLIALCVAAALVAINLGFGCRFPQFNEDNPSRIAAGAGGIITALASIAYVAIIVIILATPAYYYMRTTYMNRPSNTPIVILAFGAFLLISAAATVIPLYVGIRALNKRDY
jgi:ABC-2 type transport system permease protein